MLNIIVAVAENGVIGGDNKLLWHLPTDTKYFKDITKNNIVIMGRKSFEAIGKPLPNRDNIVISRNENYYLNGCYTVTSLEKSIELAQKLQFDSEPNESLKKIFVIGGAEIYKLATPLMDKLYVTEVKGEFEGDAFFDSVDLNTWREISRDSRKKDEKNNYDYDFVVYQRI